MKTEKQKDRERAAALVRLVVNSESGKWFYGFVLGWMSEANPAEMEKAARFYLEKRGHVQEGEEILREFDRTHWRKP